MTQQSSKGIYPAWEMKKRPKRRRALSESMCEDNYDSEFFRGENAGFGGAEVDESHPASLNLGFRDGVEQGRKTRLLNKFFGGAID